MRLLTASLLAVTVSLQASDLDDYVQGMMFPYSFAPPSSWAEMAGRMAGVIDCDDSHQVASTSSSWRTLPRIPDAQNLVNLIKQTPGDNHTHFSKYTLMPFAVALSAGVLHRATLDQHGKLEALLDYYYHSAQGDRLKKELYQLVNQSLSQTLSASTSVKKYSDRILWIKRYKIMYYHLLQQSKYKANDFDTLASQLYQYIYYSPGRFERSKVDAQQTALFLFYHLGMKQEEYVSLRDLFLSTPALNPGNANPISQLVSFITFLVIEHQFSQVFTHQNFSQDSFLEELQHFLFLAQIKSYTILADWLTQPSSAHACHNYVCYGYVTFFYRLVSSMDVINAKPAIPPEEPYRGYNPAHYHWYLKAWQDTSHAMSLRQTVHKYFEDQIVHDHSEDRPY